MKDKIIGLLKFFLLVFVMFMGFFSTYAIVWVKIGFPVDWGASLIVFSLSLLSIWGYVKWLMN